jgi:hypothetical protein
MKITRDVILDLLPLYLANEVSEDTRALVEEYLETDPQLAKLTEQSAAMELRGEIPVPLTQDDEMKAYMKAKRQIILRTFILAGVISIILIIAVLFMFFSSS